MQHGVKYSLSSSMMSSNGTGDTPRKAMWQRMFTHNNVVYYDTVVGIVSALLFVAEEIEACNGLLKDGWLLCQSGSARLCYGNENSSTSVHWTFASFCFCCGVARGHCTRSDHQVIVVVLTVSLMQCRTLGRRVLMRDCLH